MPEIRALRESELEQHADLVFLSYSHERDLEPGSMLTHPDWWLRAIEHDPYYQPEQTRVMVLVGRLVSSATCFPRPTYVSGPIARAACLGSVCTHPEYRRRGYLRQVLAEAVNWMTEAGFLWSFLYGVEAVYGGSGWRMLAQFDLTADLCVQEQYGQSLSARPVDPEQDLPLLADLYEQHCSRLTGPTVRTRQYWRLRILSPRLRQDRRPAYWVLERGGAPVGYYAASNASVVEIAWSDAPREVLAFVLRQHPGQPVSFPCCTGELVSHLRALSHVPSQQALREHRGGLTLTESYQGLWRYLADPRGRFPQVSDTESLLRFLREREYVMWPADRA